MSGLCMIQEVSTGVISHMLRVHLLRSRNNPLSAVNYLVWANVYCVKKLRETMTYTLRLKVFIDDGNCILEFFRVDGASYIRFSREQNRNSIYCKRNEWLSAIVLAQQIGIQYPVGFKSNKNCACCSLYSICKDKSSCHDAAKGWWKQYCILKGLVYSISGIAASSSSFSRFYTNDY